MFQALASLVAKTGTLTVILTSKNEQMTATVLPKPELAKEFPALGSGLSITKPPAELDAEFAKALENFTPQYSNAFDQIKSFKEAADQALADAREKSKKDVASASKGKYVPPAKKTTTTTAPPPLLAGPSDTTDANGDDDDDDGDGEASGVQATAGATSATGKPPVPPLPTPKDEPTLPSLF